MGMGISARSRTPIPHLSSPLKGEGRKLGRLAFICVYRHLLLVTDQQRRLLQRELSK